MAVGMPDPSPQRRAAARRLRCALRGDAGTTVGPSRDRRATYGPAGERKQCGPAIKRGRIAAPQRSGR
ncbi:MAG: hypothetical protein C0483_18585 [Pirellula sp.]|nr:hypothetical protein [Pirellula sp.]